MRKHNKNGFTLTELLLFMGIFTMLITMITSIFLAVIDAKLDAESTSDVEDDGKYILSRFIYDISRASSISTPAAIGNQSTTLQLNIDNVTYSYALSGDNLQVTNNNGTDVLNGVNTSISNLTFTRIGNGSGSLDTVKVNFRITGKIIQQTGTQIEDYQTTIGLKLMPTPTP